MDPAHNKKKIMTTFTADGLYDPIGILCIDFNYSDYESSKVY